MPSSGHLALTINRKIHDVTLLVLPTLTQTAYPDKTCHQLWVKTFNRFLLETCHWLLPGKL